MRATANRSSFSVIVPTAIDEIIVVYQTTSVYCRILPLHLMMRQAVSDENWARSAHTGAEIKWLTSLTARDGRAGRPIGVRMSGHRHRPRPWHRVGIWTRITWHIRAGGAVIKLCPRVLIVDCKQHCMHSVLFNKLKTKRQLDCDVAIRLYTCNEQLKHI